MRLFFVPVLLWCSFAHAATLSVTSDADTNTAGTLRYALANAKEGDTIDCTPVAPTRVINLGSSLPATQFNLAIINTGAPVTVNGQNLAQAFSVAAATLDIENIIVQNAYSIGGAGGNGCNGQVLKAGGGGGAGGGGAIYVHTGASVIVTDMQFSNNHAVGGVGGGLIDGAQCGGGGGGGGFGGGAGGTQHTGGGGHSNSGSGGTIASSGVGGSGSFLGGGGGGSGQGGISGTGKAGGAGKGSMIGGGGGGGAGSTGKDCADDGTGGAGGEGIGSDKGFGCGGGGRGSKQGGAGVGASGGGGGQIGGKGGLLGGGGGGGSQLFPSATDPSQGGDGGFGGGGGGCTNVAGSTPGKGGFGAGAGGKGGAMNGGAGGGGGGFGGAIFLGTGASLTLQGSPGFAGNKADKGIGGASTGGGAGEDGQAISDDIFIRTGATLTFSHINTLNFSSNINSEGGTGCKGRAGIKLTSGTVIFSAATPNTYSCGTEIVGGTLQVTRNDLLGELSSKITLGNSGILSFPADGEIPREVTLSGNVGNFSSTGTLTLSGKISGPGTLGKLGNGTVILTNTNSYTGGVQIQAGDLQGNTNNLLGNIAIQSSGAQLIFKQTFEAVYGGQLSGPGIFQKTESGVLHVTGTSASFTGTTEIIGGELNLTGSLGNGSAAIVRQGAILSGTGVIGSTGFPLINKGTIIPGSPSLRINGSFQMDPGSKLNIEIDPLTSGQLAVTGSAMLNSDLNINFNIGEGFFGFGRFVVVLTAQGGLMNTQFSNVNNTTPSAFNFFPLQIVYLPTEVLLFYRVKDPFLYCSLPFKNEQIVAKNLVELNLTGGIPFGSPLIDAFQTLTGQSCSAVADALDECHPAPYSAFSEFQAVAGSEILSLFQRRPVPACCCPEPRKLWAEPFAAWLDQESQGEQLGFNAKARGLAFGLDGELSQSVILGLGGVWNKEDLYWKKNRGNGHVEGYYAALYADYFNDDNYVGATVAGGFDYFDVSRKISFVNLGTDTSFRALDIMARLTAAHFFGSSLLALYPYTNLDLLYLKTDAFTEHNVPGLDLDVRSNMSSTLRTELGVTIQAQDRNNAGNICVSPLISGAWVTQIPIQRQVYTANFAHQTIPFQVHGWEHTRQIFLMRFGVDFSYNCLSLSAAYSAEMSSGSFLAQKGNVRFEWSF